MSKTPEPLKPLKTWSYLAGNRRRPSEYEIVSTNLHTSLDNPEQPWEMDINAHMNQWYLKYRNNSPLQMDDWDLFKDPDQLVYRTYNILQDGQETYVNSLFDQFSHREHDKSLDQEWVELLARAYSPVRYLYHGLQMGSAYIAQMAPASTITNCATFQTADSLRWLTHTAYRTRELSITYPDIGFGQNERQHWEEHAGWQGFRELLEKALIAWDWGEAFVAINLVLKPSVDASILHQLGNAGRQEGDTLLGLLTDAHLRDSERHNRWSTALVKYALEYEGNKKVLSDWYEAWIPLGMAAARAYCSMLPDEEDAADQALQALKDVKIRLDI